MDKVKIPKEVADAIEGAWNEYQNNVNQYEDIPDDPKYLALNNWDLIDSRCNVYWATLKDFAEENPITYMRALVEGYEIEKSPEEIIKEYYDKTVASYDHFRAVENDGGIFDSGVLKGIRYTLKTFKIKIDGIND